MTTLSFDVLWRDRGASKGMQDLGKHTQRTSERFGVLKQAAGNALADLAKAAIRFGGDSVAAYVDAQTQQVKLQDAFRKFPKLADTNQAALQRLNTELQKKTKFDDDATASGQAVLAQFRLTGQQITQLTPLLQDYAAKTGKDLPTAARDLGKAVLGQGRSLKAVGINFKDTGSQAGNLDQIMVGLRTQVGGFATQEGKSAAGQAAILKNQFGELQESAGKQLLPALLALGRGLLRVVGFVQDNSAIFGTFGKTVKIVFSSISEAVGLGKGSFKDFSDFIATHQEGITSAIIKGGKAFVAFGTVLAKAASGGLRAFGAFADGVGAVQVAVMSAMGAIIHAQAEAFGWIPGLGAKLKDTDAKWSAFTSHVAANTHKTGDAARGLADGIDNKLIPGLSKAGRGLDEMGKKAITAARARDITARAEIRHRDALDAATRAAKANGKTLDSNTASGRSNRVALNNLVSSSQNYISKLVATHASSKRVTEATKTARAEFIRVAEKMGVSAGKAKELADKYFKIPRKVETKTSAPGAVKAKDQINDVHNAIKNTKGKSVSVDISVKSTLSALNKAAVKQFGKGAFKAAVATGGVLPGYTPGRDVHRFVSATGGQLDLSGGEAVMRPEVTQAVGKDWVDGANQAARTKGVSGVRDFMGTVPAFADGGVVSRNVTAAVSAHGTTYNYGKLRDYAASATSAAIRAGVTAAVRIGTAAAVAAGVKAAKAAQAAAASAGGGPIGKGGYASALGYARAHRGHPYVYASLWDCSGFMSALHSIILGQRPHRRYTTTAFHGAHAAGFTRGKSSPFMVGVRPLSGKFGHMAGTLNGVNVESAGGVGVRVGGSARGAHSSMFSWRGGLAKGGVIGDLPFDLLDPQGERYQPELADLLHKAGYHRGGRVGGDGPERILSPRQNRAFEHLVRVMDRRGAGGGNVYHVTINAPNYMGSRSEFKNSLVQMARSGDLDVVLARAGAR